MRMILNLVITALVLLLVAYVIPGFFISGFGIALLIALVLGLINITIKPIILLITLPVNIITLGLFSFVINALMLGLAAWVVPGFEINSFWSALGAAILLAILTPLIQGVAEPNNA